MARRLLLGPIGGPVRVGKGGPQVDAPIEIPGPPLPALRLLNIRGDACRRSQQSWVPRCFSSLHRRWSQASSPGRSRIGNFGHPFWRSKRRAWLGSHSLLRACPETSDRRDVFGGSEVRLGLIADRSRRRYRHANQLPIQIEMLIVRCKQDKPHSGAPKIPDRLAHPVVRTPATRCRRSSGAQARARRPRRPAEAATPRIIFCAATPASGLRPLVWVNAPWRRVTNRSTEPCGIGRTLAGGSARPG